MTSSACKSVFFGVLVAAIAGCGDDAAPAMDAGPDRMDTGTVMLDGGPRDTGRRDTGPRDAGSPRFRECDPYAPGSCPEGEKCSVVLEQFEDTTMNRVLFACVDRPGMVRTLGQFCGRFGVDATP